MNAFLVAKLGEDITRKISEFDDVKQTQKLKFEKHILAWFRPCPSCNKPHKDPRDIGRSNKMCGRYCVDCDEDRPDCVCERPSFWNDPNTSGEIQHMMDHNLEAI